MPKCYKNSLLLLLVNIIIWKEVTCTPQMWEVDAKPNDHALLSLEEDGLVDIWSSLNGMTQIVVESENVERVRLSLKEAHIGLSLLEADLLSIIADEKKHMESKRARRKRAIGRMDWSSYHRLNDIEGFMGWLNATYYGTVSVIPVAQTFEGNHVYAVRVTDPTSRGPKKKIWIEGGIHAREWISPAVTTYLLHQVVTSPEFKSVLAESDWYFVPVSNPDGYEYSFQGDRARMWRKNRSIENTAILNRCRGVDLNRNWDLKWGVGASKRLCSDIYRGKKPFSEPETDGLRRVMEREGPFDLFITFHSFGQTVLYPWGWTTKPPNNVEELSNLGMQYVNAVKHASSGKTRYKIGGSGDVYGLASGASDDWSYGAMHTPYSYTIELRDTGNYGFLLPENQIMDTVQESAAGVYCMASYLTNAGRCSRPGRDNPGEPRSRSSLNNERRLVIFE